MEYPPELIRVKPTRVIVISLLLNCGARAETNATLAGSNAGSQRVSWKHPAGQVTEETIAEIRSKVEAHDWARKVYAARKASVEPWLAISSEKLRAVFPKKRGNVYHNFSCPQDRSRLTFDPFNAAEFTCPTCAKKFAPDTDAGIYSPSDRYHGSMYDGWICMFHLGASEAAAGLAVLSRTETDQGPKYAARAIELLLLYADVLENLPTRVDRDPQMSVLLTYHREGDSAVLNQLATAYESVRDRMTPGQRERYSKLVLERMLNDLMLERIYTYNHNNLYQWHRTILQTALALEREDLIDWCFGYGAWDPSREPEHHSLRRLLKTHFKPDGAYWEMCSGYHLYPVQALCEVAMLSRNLARMDPARFPAERYDLTDPANTGYPVLRNALHWFLALAPPDRIMPTIGDSMAPRAGMDDYYMTAEAGYRYFDLKAIGDYERLRKGERTWAGLLYGAPEIVQTTLPYTSSYLSSGWVALRNEWRQNKVWLGLNALIPGGGHQHADRLSLLTYSHGRLLSFEKATPYNEGVTRELGTLSPSHSTVTVDMQSQKRGAALSGAEIPTVSFFVAGSIAQYAELQADRLYPQTRTFRRSVALLEDICVDVFRVIGGTNHDWMLQHAGLAPEFSMKMEPGAFVPTNWLANGNPGVRRAVVTGQWEARWSLPGVTSRVTLLGAPATEVYALETYPIDNAVITSSHPPCQTLCVRRHDDQPFIAIGDAWQNEPSLVSVAACDNGSGLSVKTKANSYRLLWQAGNARFGDGVSIASDAAFTLLRNRDGVMLVHATRFDLDSSEGSLHVRMTEPASLVAENRNGKIVQQISGDVQYDTYGGIDHPRPEPKSVVTIKGTLWPGGQTK